MIGSRELGFEAFLLKVWSLKIEQGQERDESHTRIKDG